MGLYAMIIAGFVFSAYSSWLYSKRRCSFSPTISWIFHLPSHRASSFQTLDFWLWIQSNSADLKQLFHICLHIYLMERFILSSHVKTSVHLPVYCTIWANLGNGRFICFSADLGNDDSHDFFVVIFLSLTFPQASKYYLSRGDSAADIRNGERVAWYESLNSNKEKRL